MAKTIIMYSCRDKGTATSHEGGPVNTVSSQEYLERFLLIGATDGTFYAEKRAFAEESLDKVAKVIADIGIEAVDMIVRVGQNVPKHDHVLVAYALAISTKDIAVRTYALSKFNEVIRTGTHLFHLAEFIKGRRGWGTGLRKAVQRWYLDKSDIGLATQLVKYKQRDGWTHRDIMRLSHPMPKSATQQGMISWALGNPLMQMDSSSHDLIAASERIHDGSLTVHGIAQYIVEYQLPREVVPTQYLKYPEIWQALLSHMGQTAMLRNLRNMHKCGLMVQGSDATRQIVESIADTEWLRKGRIHPAQIFLAKQNASVIPRASVWDAPTRRDPTFPQSVLNALESAFYKSFDNLQGTDKRIMLAIDVSGSMSSSIAGMSVTAAEWAALMAMVTLRQAPHAEVYGFSANFINLGITAYDSMEDVMRKTADKNFGGTNCALPLKYATQQNMKFDAFVVYTDSETGSLQYVPSALQKYRASSGVQDSKLIVSATESNDITIGDGNDPNTLGVCGVSASAPKAIENFMLAKSST